MDFFTLSVILFDTSLILSTFLEAFATSAVSSAIFISLATDFVILLESPTPSATVANLAVSFSE